MRGAGDTGDAIVLAGRCWVEVRGRGLPFGARLKSANAVIGVPVVLGLGLRLMSQLFAQSTYLDLSSSQTLGAKHGSLVQRVLNENQLL